MIQHDAPDATLALAGDAANAIETARRGESVDSLQARLDALVEVNDWLQDSHQASLVFRRPF